MNYFARLPNDVVQHDGGLGDFWNLRDKQSFQVAKANNTPGLACMPTVATYATVPRKRYGDSNHKCPRYTQFHPVTNCCVTDMTGDGSGSRFMQKLAQAIKRIENTEIAQTIFDPRHCLVSTEQETRPFFGRARGLRCLCVDYRRLAGSPTAERTMVGRLPTVPLSRKAKV